MVVTQQLMTVTEFEEFVQRPENRERAWELINGVPVEMPSSSKRNTVVAMRVGAYISFFVIQHDLGYVTGADGGYAVGDHDTRQPDVGFIRKERVPDLEGITFDGAPDLAVEVISPSESSREVLDKTKLYLRTGSKLVWNLYAEQQIVDVCTLAANGDDLVIKTVGMDGVLGGGDALPGFTLAAKSIFP